MNKNSVKKNLGDVLDVNCLVGSLRIFLCKGINNLEDLCLKCPVIFFYYGKNFYSWTRSLTIFSSNKIFFK